MLNKRIIDEFLARKLDSFDWLKDCSRKELLAALSELKPKPDFGQIKPWDHQLACFLILLELKRFIFHIDMGGGKTLLTLMLLKYRKQRGDKPKAIVFVPYITSVETWVEEVKKHAPDLLCVPLLGSGNDNLSAMSAPGDLFVICYQSALAMVSETATSKKGKTKWTLTPKQVRKYFADFDMLVMDEIHKCKGVTSLYYRMCRAISAQCDWVMGLTGTPFGKDLQDLWPQYYLIDFGETLGPTMGFYRDLFFDSKQGYFGGYKHTFKKKLMPKLERTIKNCSIYYGIDEFYDMPPKEYIIKNVNCPDASNVYAEASTKKLREAIKDGQYREVESEYLKLRQLSSGFMTLKGTDDDKIQIRLEDNPKLEALEDILISLPFGRKAIIFHHFVFTNTIISDRLKKLKINHARIWGKQKDPIGQLRLFKDNPDCTVLVLNDKSGSSSLNLQTANYLIYFEQPDSPIDRQQSERRVWRPGQSQRVLIYDLLMRRTADYPLYKSNKAGADMLKQLLAGKVRL
jgi:non-specific serine/threonine protein kinase